MCGSTYPSPGIHTPPYSESAVAAGDAVRTADAALQLEITVGARSDAQAADGLEDAKLRVQLDAVAAELHHRLRWVELGDEARGVVGRPARQLPLLDQHDVAHTRLGEVIRAADARDAASHDDGCHAT
jgi:hypothetical protein